MPTPDTVLSQGKSEADYEVARLLRAANDLADAWTASWPHLSLAGLGREAFPRYALQVVVQDILVRSLQNAEGIWHCLRHELMAPYYLLSRNLFEAEVLLRWLESLEASEREIEVQVAMAQPAFATLAKIGNKELADADGMRRRAAREELNQVREFASNDEVMKRAQQRSNHNSWTGRDTITLTNNLLEYHEVFGQLSRLGHPPSALIMRHALEVTIGDLEAEAHKSRKRLRSVSIHAEHLLGVSLTSSHGGKSSAST